MQHDIVKATLPKNLGLNLFVTEDSLKPLCAFVNGIAQVGQWTAFSQKTVEGSDDSSCAGIHWFLLLFVDLV